MSGRVYSIPDLLCEAFEAATVRPRMMPLFLSPETFDHAVAAGLAQPYRPCQGDPTFAGVEILKSDGIPPGTAIAVCRPSAEHRRAMEGMTAEERGRYMAALRLAVVVRDVGGQP